MITTILTALLPSRDAPIAGDALAVLGFAVCFDELPTRFVMRDRSDRHVDFNTVTFDAKWRRNAATAGWQARSLSGSGLFWVRAGGRRSRCPARRRACSQSITLVTIPMRKIVATCGCSRMASTSICPRRTGGKVDI